MQFGRPNAIGKVSCSCVAWLAELTHSSGSRRTTSDWPRVLSCVTKARSRLPRLMCSTRPGVGSQITVSSTRGLERAKRAMISGQEAVGIVVGRADADRAFEAAIVEGGQRLAVEMDEPPRVGQQALAVFAEPVAPPLLLEQRLADPLLQPPHLHRYGGLRAVYLVGGAGEAAGVGNGDESVHLVEIERGGHRTSHHSC